MSNLIMKKCVPCESNIPPLFEDEIEDYHKQVPEWDVVKVDGIPRLKRRFKLKNFAEALAFTNKIGEISEEQGHHPVIQLTWGEVTVEWWTHNIKGLHENDFIMAARTDAIYEA